MHNHPGDIPHIPDNHERRFATPLARRVNAVKSIDPNLRYSTFIR